jgi:hypothetical protein
MGDILWLQEVAAMFKDIIVSIGDPNLQIARSRARRSVTDVCH